MTETPKTSDTRGAVVFVTALAALWLGLSVTEAYNTWRASSEWRKYDVVGTPPYDPLLNVVADSDPSGGLVRTMGLVVTGDIFAEPQRWEFQTDERGYRNAPGLARTYCPVVITGDSFIVSGARNADTPSEQLSHILGVPVYNGGYPGRGPLRGVQEFLANEAFKRPPPKVLVWGFCDRNVFAPSLQGQDAAAAPSTGSTVQKLRVALHRLKGAMNVPSYLGSWCYALRAEATYRLTGRPPSDKIIAVWRGDRAMLFLADHVRCASRKIEERELAAAVQTIEAVADTCSRRGVHLITLLIPSKVHLYARWLSDDIRPELPEPAVLDALAERLEARGLDVVNLLPVYASCSADDQPWLYAHADTHWSRHGVHVAMEAVARRIEAHGVRIADARDMETP